MHAGDLPVPSSAPVAAATFAAAEVATPNPQTSNPFSTASIITITIQWQARVPAMDRASAMRGMADDPARRPVLPANLRSERASVGDVRSVVT